MHLRKFLQIGLVAATMGIAVPCLNAGGAAYGLPAEGLAPWSHIGRKVDGSTGGSVCLEGSYDECEPAVHSTQTGGFGYPSSVAMDFRTGDVYVAELVNARVQELTAAGAFVSMFGWDVNRTAEGRATATQAEKNVCTAASKDVCGSGASGTEAGQFDAPSSVAVDPLSGDLYVLSVETGDFRLDKYTRAGRFVWRRGKGVNRAKRGDLCTEEEIERTGVRCGPGASNASESLRRGAFKFSSQSGDMLAVGGPEDLVYVADEHRVQVFGTDGVWRREVLLVSLSAEQSSSVVALALAPTGDVYLVYRVGNGEPDLPPEHADIVHRFGRGGNQIAEYLVQASSANAVDSIDGMAIDRSGRVAVMGVEVGGASPGRIGLLYGAEMSGLLTRFMPPVDNEGIAFGADGRLYVATAIGQEVAVYAAAPLAELMREPVPCEVRIQGPAIERLDDPRFDNGTDCHARHG